MKKKDQKDLKSRARAFFFQDIFKIYLRKNLGQSDIFMDNIWTKIKRDTQYQLENIQD